METIAVYWEPIIQVYGFDSRKNAAFIELDFPLEDAYYWGECIETLASTGSGFIMALAQYINTGTLRICIAIHQDYADSCRQLLGEYGKKSYKVTLRSQQPVDILFFHGPHFQDRYGIAEAAFRTLNQDRITLHSVSCTGTSVYIVVNGGETELAKEMLSQGFMVPGYKTSNSNG